MGSLTIGRGSEDGTDVGPLIDDDQRGKVAELVTDAVGKGAKVLVGGEADGDRGYFYKPTVLTDVPDGADLLREEIFGPVAPLVTFTDEEEALAMANDTEYGLVSYVYTRDLARGLRLSARLDSGMVGLNRGLVSDPAAPFGGTKQSGIGREGGHEGMLDYTESKYVAVSW
jgi:succinate-semialdehyde dehydrogenase / glutarate-semialdehyde dehydrogenase